jgi:RNA polymerase sigma-70 factor (ECF subfamily)
MNPPHLSSAHESKTERGALEGVGDAAIVVRILAGETSLFELLMRRHNQRLFRAARSIVRSDDEAEDVMQEAYVRAFTHLAQFEGRAQFSTWLTRIAVHEALGRARKRRAYVEPEDADMGSELETPEGAVSKRELSAILEPMVDALPAGFRAVFVLRAVEGLSVAEVAACLEIPEETVRTRFLRARRALRVALEERFADAGREIYTFHLQRCDRVVHDVLSRL